MPIDSICPGCARTLRVSEEHAGTEAQCPVCHTVYQVPASSHPSLNNTPAEPSPEKLYFVRIPTGIEFGPASRNVMAQWIRENRVNAACLIREESQAEWIPFLDWFSKSGVTEELGIQTESLQTPANPSPADSSFGMVTVGTGNVVAYPVPSRGTQVLILGILSCFLCITWVGSLVVSVIALSIGYRDLRNIASGKASPSERNLTRIGMCLAGAALILSILTLVVLILAALNA